jgi:hypothetical protein
MPRRLFTFASAAAVLAAAGCAQLAGPSNPDRDDLENAFRVRARIVADAWATSTANGAWHTGFVPLQELTVAPAAGFGTDDAKQAFIAGWYSLRTDLTAGRPADGKIHFPDETVLDVPLVSAREAYTAIDQGDPPVCAEPSTAPPPEPSPADPDASVGVPAQQACSALTVTAAKLASTMVRTSRGTVAVPAWLFTVDGLAEPIARVAVDLSAVSPVPTVNVPPFTYTAGLVTAQDLIGVKGTELTFRLGVGACDTDIRPLVVETPEVVLVAGTVVTTGDTCIDILKLEPVTVTISEPLGERAVLDGLNGQPLVLTVR